ncbi:MAG: SHOCT domain-containing protein [Clostridia bacterium]|nr:SHOCT domain-containing protein [Clostridia bacterium]
MKKTLNQIIMVIGFVVMVVGILVGNIQNGLATLTTFSTVVIAAVFAVTCIFASNSVIKNIGYALASLVAAYGVGAISMIDFDHVDIGALLTAIGMVLMGVAALLYALIFVLKLLGFVKSSETKEDKAISTTLDELGRYKEMLQDKILTEEEFDDLKQKVLANADNRAISIDDLKKWKKLLDQQIITEAEFKQIKEGIFSK